MSSRDNICSKSYESASGRDSISSKANSRSAHLTFTRTTTCDSTLQKQPPSSPGAAVPGLFGPVALSPHQAQPLMNPCTSSSSSAFREDTADYFTTLSVGSEMACNSAKIRIVDEPPVMSSISDMARNEAQLLSREKTVSLSSMSALEARFRQVFDL